jgi:hypothetical protein
VPGGTVVTRQGGTFDEQVVERSELTIVSCSAGEFLLLKLLGPRRGARRWAFSRDVPPEGAPGDSWTACVAHGSGCGGSARIRLGEVHHGHETLVSFECPEAMDATREYPRKRTILVRLEAWCAVSTRLRVTVVPMQIRTIAVIFGYFGVGGLLILLSIAGVIGNAATMIGFLVDFVVFGSLSFAAFRCPVCRHVVSMKNGLYYAGVPCYCRTCGAPV